jgi:paraquat-inducible protein B
LAAILGAIVAVMQNEIEPEMPVAIIQSSPLLRASSNPQFFDRAQLQQIFARHSAANAQHRPDGRHEQIEQIVHRATTVLRIGRIKPRARVSGTRPQTTTPQCPGQGKFW